MFRHQTPPCRATSPGFLLRHRVSVRHCWFKIATSLPMCFPYDQNSFRGLRTSLAQLVESVERKIDSCIDSRIIDLWLIQHVCGEQGESLNCYVWAGDLRATIAILKVPILHRLELCSAFDAYSYFLIKSKFTTLTELNMDTNKPAGTKWQGNLFS